jgi:hypothetical protein
MSATDHGKDGMPGERDFMEPLVGRELDAVHFIRDYWQFSFDGPTLTVASVASVVRGAVRVRPGDAGHCDGLCALIGRTVTGVTLVPDRELRVAFGDETELVASLAPEDYHVEAVILDDSARGGSFLVY